MDERRKNQRVGISFPIECSLPSKKNYFYTVCKDLSSSGVKIISQNFIPKDALVKVNINFIDRMVNLKAKVAWCNKERVSERYSAGLEFMEVNNENKKELADFLGGVFNA